MKRIAALTIGLAMLASGAVAAAQTPAGSSIPAQSWAAYKDRFVDDSGRVVDDGNGGVSHSEGQGYGMLLAYFAGSKADFDFIWAFTRNELLLRDDGLAAWKWDPNASPHVSDLNNATDGDILIAYALALAGKAWQNREYTEAAAGIVRAIASNVLVRRGDAPLLLPGVDGFASGERGDGPVVNLSYWVFEAFPVFAELDSETGWQSVSDQGLTLLRQTIGESGSLPPEWLSLAARPRPAKDFAAEFSYNALRIPLYLTRSDIGADDTLRQLANAMSADGGVAIRNLETGETKETLTDPGYRIIPAIALCKTDGRPVPEDLRAFQPTLYYPSTLHLLALAWLDAGGCR